MGDEATSSHKKDVSIVPIEQNEVVGEKEIPSVVKRIKERTKKLVWFQYLSQCMIFRDGKRSIKLN